MYRVKGVIYILEGRTITPLLVLTGRKEKIIHHRSKPNTFDFDGRTRCFWTVRVYVPSEHMIELMNVFD